MILIADSGSTKTDWALLDAGKSTGIIRTGGLNPYMQTTDDMVCKLKDTALGKLAAKGVDRLWFYGAGCTPGEKSRSVAIAMKAIFGSKCEVQVATDMLGAARALCQQTEGIACILGTGSNSCLYDGRGIVANTPPLGYILGDEGSGAHLGKLLVGNILKGQMPQEITDRFFDETGITGADIIDKVYRQPFPNRWLASLSPFIHRHLAHQAVRTMVLGAFTAFFTRNVANYNRKDLPIGIAGSVAYHYQDIVREAAATLGMTIAKVAQSPMEGLVDFHK